METSARREPTLLTPRQIFARLDAYVIGQEAAKRAVAIAAYNHLKRIEARRHRRGTLLKKSNMLLIGPTGSGKTHIARQLADILSVPFTTVDATEYTEAGYYGKDVEMMVAELLIRANHVVEDAQRGIIFIDEVDKIARRSQGARNGAGSRDIGGEGVQQALLKLLEGRDVQVPIQVSAGWNRSDTVALDTRDVLFICAGTFSDLFGDGEDGHRRSLGFNAVDGPPRRRVLRTRELVDYGMMAEFLGRLPVVVQLHLLGEDDLLRVLVEPPDAITREYRELLALDDVSLTFREDALREVVRFSVSRGLGARGLRSVLEHVMADVMFEAPERRARSVVVDRGFVHERLKTADDAVAAAAH
ncbi:MAG: ATP-dependent Clp protease ATP-binding subunit ClpX [Myxococcaceae bacterium]|nr:ATP-dependent Clp protease ATP-binding subunit ClpX [Myxococcaceae bacterium]MCI0673139.1 ATP-dependent Clp protease ATP-binding subunit ClpX [Myxococcaceae bacterium]